DPRAVIEPDRDSAVANGSVPLRRPQGVVLSAISLISTSRRCPRNNASTMPDPVVRPYGPTRISCAARSTALIARAAQSLSDAKQVLIVAAGAAAASVREMPPANASTSQAQQENTGHAAVVPGSKRVVSPCIAALHTLRLKRRFTEEWLFATGRRA